MQKYELPLAQYIFQKGLWSRTIANDASSLIIFGNSLKLKFADCLSGIWTGVPCSRAQSARAPHY